MTSAIISRAIERGFARVQFIAAARSWKLRQSQNFTVADRGITLPIANGIGLDLIGQGRTALSDVIEWVYAQRVGAFIDIGANIGRSLVELLRFDRTIEYVGFEPQIAAAAHVDSIIRANGLSKTHSVIPIGLSGACRIATFLSNTCVDVSGTINTDTRPESAYEARGKVALGTGDAFLSGVPRIALLKVDAEGAEVGILRGLQRTIHQHKPVITFEVLPIVELEAGTSWTNLSAEGRAAMVAVRKQHARDIQAVLNSYGYVIGHLVGGCFVPGADLERSSENAYDFVAVPR